MNSKRRLFPALLAAGLLVQPPPAPAQQGAATDTPWLECTGEAHPPPSARPVPGRLPVIVETNFRVAAVREAFEAEWGDEPDVGCALFLMRWTREGELEAVRVLETDLDDGTVSRLQELLVQGRVLRAPSSNFIRVLARPSSAAELAVGFAWEDVPSLANPDEVDDLVAAVQIGTASRRDVALRATIAEDGTVEQIEISRPSGDSFVDQQFLWISEFFLFRPAAVEGTAISGMVILPFTIQEDRGG